MQDSIYIYLIAILVPFNLVLFLIPQIRTVAYKRNFVSRPNHRKLHGYKIPNVGGAAIFTGVLISSLVLTDWAKMDYWQYIYAGALIIFIVSLRDDLLEIKPIEKFGGQIIAGLVVILGSGWRMDELYQLFNLQEVHFLSNIVVTLLVFLVIVNAFNLIDGVDGLASLMVIFAHAVFVLESIFVNQLNPFTLFSVSVLGGYLAFLPFNYSNSRKTFMGDVGSSFAGYSTATLFIFIVNTNSSELGFNVKNNVFYALLLIIIPVVDLFRLFITRIMQKKSPFAADTQHIHHILLKAGLPHKYVALCIFGFQLSLYVLFNSINRYIQRDDSFLMIITTLLVLIVLISVLNRYLPKPVELNQNKKKVERSK